MNITVEFITNTTTNRQDTVDGLVKDARLMVSHWLAEDKKEKTLQTIASSIGSLVPVAPDVESSTRRFVVKFELTSKVDGKLKNLTFETFRPVRNPVLLEMWDGPIWTLINHNKMLF